MTRVPVLQRLALLALLSFAAATNGCTADFNVAHLPHADAVADIDAATADGGLDALDVTSEDTRDVAPDAVDSAADGDGADCPAGCTTGQTCCSGTCVDLSNSPDHCGSCTAMCRGTICLGGQCTGTCAMGRLDCDGNVVNGCEVNAATDAMNCGACARSCRSDQMCTDGACVCMTGMGDCDGTVANGCEVNLSNDAQNCGACGMRCAAGEACTGGHCGCATGFADCDHTAANGCEVNTRTDGANCGACGTACGASATCNGGTCQCATGFLSCGATFACTTAATDPVNCGACGTSCTGATPVCGTAGCSTGCLASETRCGSSCVDTTTDVNNCGTCGTVCTVPASSPAGSTAPLCAGGMCGIQCLPGFADCDGNMTNGCEVDTRTTAANCGTCGNACGALQFCASRSCACPSTLHDCGGGVCAQCCTNTDCNDSNACTGDVCMSGTCTHSTCGAGSRCCGATVGCQGCCSDTDCSSMAGHLGCAGDGTCTTCAAGFRDCNLMPADGCEADLTTSTLNCGSCGNTCVFANAAAACSGGVCRLGTCNPGFADCDGSPANGCEVNLNTSTGNCGSCSVACTASGTVCMGGMCVVGTCSAGTGNCDGSAANGCESNLNTDPVNCGSCMNVCAFANASATCVGGTCALGTCNAGFADCDSNPANGCETNLLADPTHCGTCATVCTLPNGTASCVGGSCALGACSANFGNCDGNPANGCETDLRTSLNYCGSCSTSCSGSLPNATLTCANSTCSFSCNAGYVDCNGSSADGCEVNNATNVGHCGLCPTACTTPTNGAASCEGGSCAYACVAPNANCDNNAANGCETNLATDVNNCGGCGIVCHAVPHAQRACSGATGCTFTCDAGYADCDGNAANGCEINLTNDPTHCGACTTACSGTTPNCLSRACVTSCIAGGLANCSGSCVNRQTDRNNCGSCGSRCGDNQTCTSGSCQGIGSCSSGGTPCAGACTNLATDPMNCGACGQVCGLGTSCFASRCVRLGDDCTSPAPVPLTSGPVAFNVDMTRYTNTSSSCTSGNDVYLSITLAQPELVYVDTFGTLPGGPAVTLGFLDRCTAMPTGAACVTGSCGTSGSGSQAQIAQILATGTHLIEVDLGAGATPGTVRITIQHIPIANTGIIASPGGQLPTTFSVTGTTASLSNTVATCGLGPDVGYWWASCPAAAAGPLTAASCGGASYDTVLQLLNGDTVGGACNNDSCGQQSNLTAPVSGGAGIHVLYVDGAAASSAGTYTVTGTRP